MKKIAFGMLAIGLVTVIVGCSSDSTPKKVENNTEKTEQKEKKKEKEQVTFKVGETADVNGYQILVNSVDSSSGGEFDKPKKGNEFVLVNVTITNKTGKTQSYNPYDFKLNADGNAKDLDAMYISEDIEMLNSGELDDGASVSGTLVGEAKQGAKLKLQYHSSIFSDKALDIELN